MIYSVNNVMTRTRFRIKKFHESFNVRICQTIIIENTSTFNKICNKNVKAY